MRPAMPLTAVTLILTLALANAGCGSEAATPAYVGQWVAVVPVQGGSVRYLANFNAGGAYWVTMWWEPQGGGSLLDGAYRGTYALTSGTEAAGELTLHKAMTYDIGLGTWVADAFDVPFTYTLDTTVTPRTLRRDDGAVYAYVGPPTSNPPVP